MKERIAQKTTYLGIGIGLVLFAIYGLLPGSFIGGVAGLSMAGALFGTPVEPGIVARVIIALSMLTGVMVSGIVFLTISSAGGWLVGTVIDSIRGTRKNMANAEAIK